MIQTEPAGGTPIYLLASLGMIGMQHIKQVILAAFITGEPLLLIGPHGTANRTCSTASPSPSGFSGVITMPAR